MRWRFCGKCLDLRRVEALVGHDRHLLLRSDGAVVLRAGVRRHRVHASGLLLVMGPLHARVAAADRAVQAPGRAQDGAGRAQEGCAIRSLAPARAEHNELRGGMGGGQHRPLQARGGAGRVGLRGGGGGRVHRTQPRLLGRMHGRGRALHHAAQAVRRRGRVGERAADRLGGGLGGGRAGDAVSRAHRGRHDAVVPRGQRLSFPRRGGRLVRAHLLHLGRLPHLRRRAPLGAARGAREADRRPPRAGRRGGDRALQPGAERARLRDRLRVQRLGHLCLPQPQRPARFCGRDRRERGAVRGAGAAVRRLAGCDGRVGPARHEHADGPRGDGALLPHQLDGLLRRLEPVCGEPEPDHPRRRRRERPAERHRPERAPRRPGRTGRRACVRAAL
mmetsp:Transcript_20867/g.67315  ORF Transcript_20867/g.67315 Transcript_20867/m.67315 type:complete len:390 (-) Transcript_20867:486-1655(-)